MNDELLAGIRFELERIADQLTIRNDLLREVNRISAQQANDYSKIANALSAPEREP